MHNDLSVLLMNTMVVRSMNGVGWLNSTIDTF